MEAVVAFVTDGAQFPGGRQETQAVCYVMDLRSAASEATFADKLRASADAIPQHPPFR